MAVGDAAMRLAVPTPKGRDIGYDDNPATRTIPFNYADSFGAYPGFFNFDADGNMVISPKGVAQGAPLEPVPFGTAAPRRPITLEERQRLVPQPADWCQSPASGRDPSDSVTATPSLA